MEKKKPNLDDLINLFPEEFLKLNLEEQRVSVCPVTGERIHLKVAPDEIKELNPVDAVMSFVTPDVSKIRENVILNFCHYVHFFSSRKAGSKWISENEGTLLLSIDEAHYLGRKKNEVQYRDVLEV